MGRPTSPATKPSPPRAAFTSHPSDLELIEYYLRPWVASGLKAGPFIHEADVYAADPADLVREFSPAVARDGERAWYFLCPLRPKNGRGRRKARTVASGEGCWHNEAKSKPVISGIGERHQVGHRQSFSFVKKEGGVRVRTGWLMMELRLLADGGAQEEDAPGSLVLCKVYRSPRNPERSDEEPTAVAASSSGPKAESNDDSSSADTAAASGPKEKTNDNASSDASLAAPEREKKPHDEQESSAGTVAAPKRPRNADDEISGAATEAPPKRPREADDETAGAATETADCEGSAEKSAAAPGRKRKAAEDESSVAATAPAPTPKRRTDGDGDGAGAPATGLICCPNCGTHIAAGEAVVAVAKSKSETKSETEIVKNESTSDAPQGGETGDRSENRLPFTFL
ncbi:hypothetical protein ACP70R_037015 [Stipagrostis hirtigluma subsp. patula]